MINVISNAYADVPSIVPGATPAANGGLGSMLIILVVFLGIFYFMLWRPQNKRAQEHRNLMNNLAKGDEVVTTGGILGKISKIEDNYVSLQVAENVEIKVQKPSISAVLPKGTLKASEGKSK